MRNHILYEMKVYIGKKFLFCFRDSCILLPSSLQTLAKTLCPQLGNKGSINHDEVQVSNLSDLSDTLLPYLRQDICLLGGVMVKAQEIYWKKLNVDIENSMTLSSLAMTISRMNYYDEVNRPIYIPNRN